MARYTLLAIIIITILIVFLYTHHVIQTPATNTYTLHELPNFLSPEECDLIIEHATQKGLQPSALYEGTTDATNEQVRKSTQVWFTDNEHALIANISERISTLLKIPVSHQEALQVVQYGVGGKYEPHFDACRTDCDRMNGKAGHRYITVLIYLNDVEEGGNTRFPKLGRSIKPEKGKVVIFRNISLETNQIILEAEHGGDPVLKGEKWIANKWIHINSI